jgi:3-isopropylmalate dehydrogenase
MKILMLPGDGIGPEIAAATTEVLHALSAKFALNIQVTEEIVGHASLKKYGTTIRPELLEAAKKADGFILGPTATADFKDESKGEINPSMYFRKHLDLYANIRPSKTFKGLPGPVGEFNLVVVRENTEGFYADRNMFLGNADILVTEDVGIAVRRITRVCCNRIARSAFELAMQRKKHVTLVHKANVLRVTDGMIFLDECRKVAKEFPEVAVDDVIVDAMMAHVVRKPSRFDVIVTTNMFGDILTDLTAELAGSLGLGGSLNAGAQYAMGQASHGSAPDIAGKNIANPYSLILSGGMLLGWYGARKGEAKFVQAAAALETAAHTMVETKQVTSDVGGKLGTREAGAALAKHIAAQ